MSDTTPDGPGNDRGSSVWPDLDRLLFPRSAALVGLSDRSGPEVVANAVRKGIPVFGVHPRLREVAGMECYPSLAAAPSPADMAFMLVGHTRIERAMREAIEAGVRAFVIPGLGNEAGLEGQAVAARVAEMARDAGACAIGPNCMGLAVPDGASFWIGSIPRTFLPGHVAAVVQSGSIGEALVCLGPRVGYRCVVSSGGELVTDVADLCAHFAHDDGTQAVGLFLESVRRPQAFAHALDMLADAGKPVACLKVGRTIAGARAVLAHSGAVVGSAVAFSALLRAHGVIELEDYPELVEVLDVLGRKRRPRGTRLGGVTNSGGEGALLADHADDAGLPFRPLSQRLVENLSREFPNYLEPQNPVDAWAIDAVERVFPGTLRLLAASGDFDILVAQIDQSQFLGEPEVDNAVLTVEALADAVEGRPIFPAVTSVQSNDPPPRVVQLAAARDVALLRGSRAGLRALASVARWKPRRPPRRAPGSQTDRGDPPRAGALAEYESGTILERAGIPVSRRSRARTLDEAVKAAGVIGFPVVVKRDGPAHKSREGGVVTGVADEASLKRATERIGLPVLVAAQAESGLEVFCGMSRDDSIGPVLVVGLGGSAAEVLPGKSVCAAPVDHDMATEMITGARALPGDLGPEAVEALARVIVALGDLAVDRPEIAAIDINPLVVHERDVVAVDALVVIGDSHG